MFASSVTIKYLRWLYLVIVIAGLSVSQAAAKDLRFHPSSANGIPTFLTGQNAIVAMLLQANISNCPTNATSIRGTGRTVRCRCSVLATNSGSVWGDGTYTDDSKICRAAVHAGVISSNGGVVTFRVSAGRASYAASSRNGVESGKWGSWQGSYQFSRGAGSSAGGGSGGGTAQRSFCPATAKEYKGSARTVTCGCAGSETRAGSVWGNGVYTDDSKICRAAMHAGVIGIFGGRVTFRMVGARNSYARGSANGVNTGSYGPWSGSFAFVGGTLAGGGSSGGAPVQRAFCPAVAKEYRGSGRTVECRCSGFETRAGTVWGSGTYTDDSKICRAAVHAGQIGISGGAIRFRMVGPRSNYAKSSSNGVTTGSYGAWRGSFVFIPY